VVLQQHRYLHHVIKATRCRLAREKWNIFNQIPWHKICLQLYRLRISIITSKQSSHPSLISSGTSRCSSSAEGDYYIMHTHTQALLEWFTHGCQRRHVSNAEHLSDVQHNDSLPCRNGPFVVLRNVDRCLAHCFTARSPWDRSRRGSVSSHVRHFGLDRGLWLWMWLWQCGKEGGMFWLMFHREE